MRPLLLTSTVPSLGNFLVEITTVFVCSAEVVFALPVAEIAAVASNSTTATTRTASKSIFRIE